MPITQFYRELRLKTTGVAVEIITRRSNSASAEWEGSPIDRSSIDSLFAPFIRCRSIDIAQIEAAKLLLVEQTTWFIWRMFGDIPSSKNIKRVSEALDEFIAIAQVAVYQPPLASIRRLRKWVDAEKERQVILGRRPLPFDEVAFPWLITFFDIVLSPLQTEKRSPSGGAAQFIQAYFKLLKLAAESGRVTDPEDRGRTLHRVPLTREKGAIAKTIKVYRIGLDEAGLADLIRAKIASIEFSRSQAKQ